MAGQRIPALAPACPRRLAAWRGYRAFVDLLLERGATNPVDDRAGTKLIRQAADQGLETLFSGLLDLGVSVPGAAPGADISGLSHEGGIMRNMFAWIGVVAVLGAPAALAQRKADAAKDRTVVEQTIRDSIGWAMTKDRPLLERVIAHDADLFMFNPDSKSTVVGWDAFVKNFDFWLDPRFKATRFDVRDLRTTFSRTGDVVWFSAILDDLAEWDGKPVGWKDTRWTGVLEKRDGAWVIVQMHFSFASDKAPAEAKAAAGK